jgi:hypothetical protein
VFCGLHDWAKKVLKKVLQQIIMFLGNNNNAPENKNSTSLGTKNHLGTNLVELLYRVCGTSFLMDKEIIIHPGTKMIITRNKTNIQEQTYLWGYA